MCEFCTQHGEGKKWYLRAENYSNALAEEKRSWETTGRFIKSFNKKAALAEKAVGIIERTPRFVQKLGRWIQNGIQKKIHYGQVIPIEDVFKIFDMMTGVVRLPCVCRRYSINDDSRYCLGVTIDPLSQERNEKICSYYFGGPDLSNMEFLTGDEAKGVMREFDKRGLVHTVWTMMTPYVIGICNCSPDSCMALRFDKKQWKTFFRGEYVAVVDTHSCVGCRACVEMCPFNAVCYNEEISRAFIDPKRCYGCGVCRTKCVLNAIDMVERKGHAVAKGYW